MVVVLNQRIIRDLMSKEDIDGALVGGASLDVEKFYKIATFYA